jgi:hypothetical protein
MTRDSRILGLVSVVVSVVALAVGAGACGKGDTIGVAECDAYVAKLVACADKVGGQSGESLKRFSKRMVESWKDSASKPEQKEMLAKTCSEAIVDSRKQNPQCEW